MYDHECGAQRDLEALELQWERHENRLITENGSLQERIEELEAEIVAYQEDRELNRQELRHVYASIQAIVADLQRLQDSLGES